MPPLGVHATRGACAPLMPAPTGRTGQRSAVEPSLPCEYAPEGRPSPTVEVSAAAALRAAVPAPTGRTGQRSAFPLCAIRSALSRGRRNCKFKQLPKVGAPACREGEPHRRNKKRRQRTSFAAREVRGESVKGGPPPFTKENDQSELAAARPRRAREFRLPARSAGRFPDGAPTQSEADDPSLTKLAAPFGNRLGGRDGAKRRAA